MLCCNCVKDNNKNIYMYSQEEERVLNMSLHRRRLSLFQKQHEKVQKSQRQQIRNKCKQFIHSRKSQQQSPFSPQTSTFGITQPTQRSMPSIRQIRQQRHLVGQSLRKTISRYNYINHEKLKKLQALQRKKLKFDKVLKIREQHSKQKKRLTQSLISLHHEISEQKLKLKHSVDVTKMMTNQSRIHTLTKNKTLGDERRKQIFMNKSRISLNKTTQVQTNKKMHAEIMSEEKKLKIKKRMMSEFQRRAGVKEYCQKLKSQMKRFSQVDKCEITTSSKLSAKIGQIQKSKDIIDSKLKDYQNFLRDGATLKKPKLNLKVKPVEESKKLIKIHSVRTEQNEQDGFY